MLKMALSVAALGVASMLLMSAAAQDRGLNDRMASIEAMRDLGRPAARPRNRSELEQHAATNCHCWAQAGNYNGCYPTQDCNKIGGICKGDC